MARPQQANKNPTVARQPFAVRFSDKLFSFNGKSAIVTKIEHELKYGSFPALLVILSVC